LLSAQTFNEATAWEFDFIPSNNMLQFDFVFGSEEYPEFINSEYIDASSFLLSEIGISGTFANFELGFCPLAN
jgi:hypothetical protein